MTLRRQFAWLVVVLLSVGVARFLAGHYLNSSLDAALHRNVVAAEANRRMLQDLTDAETAVRGYQLTGDLAFLEPYRSGAGDYPRALRQARDNADATVGVHLRAQDAAARRWLVDFAIPIASAAPGRPGVDAGRSAEGKALFDRIRAANNDVATALERRSRADAAAYRTANAVLESGLALLALVSVAITLRIWRNAQRSLLAPLQDMRRVFDDLNRGDTAVRAAVAGPPEARALATALNERLVLAADAKRRLEAQSAYLTQILDAIDVAVLTCDAEGNIVHLNRAARGRRPDGSDPTTVAELDAAVDRAGGAHPLIRALRGETVDKHEMALRPDRSILVDARALHDGEGRVIGAVTTGYDVTVLREREAELAAFAGIAAHDLKSPLTAIAGFAEILAEDLDDAEQAEIVARIRAGVERMRRLIDDLLAYATARDAPLRPEPVDLGRLVEDIAADRGPHAATAVRHGPLPVLRADPGMIRQLFENLIGNALKYTPPERAAEVDVSAAATPEGVRVVVADRGIGIPADQQARVFTSFHRAHAGRGYGGTGLGLAICQRVVARHGGGIAASDNPGGGTRITVDLPADAVVTPASIDAVRRERAPSGHAQPRA